MSTALDRAQASITRAHQKTRAMEQTVVRKVVIAATGGGLGFASKKGMREEIAGVPIKLGIATLGAVGEIFFKGAMQRFSGAVGDASLAIYTHEAVQEGSFVAGGEV